MRALRAPISGDAQPLSVVLLALVLFAACIGAKAQPVTTEQVTVQAPARSATGVSGEAAGGGLIGEQTEPRARSTVSVDFIAKQAPVSNAFDLLRLAPGANTATSDPYGLSPSVNVAVRGLNGDEIAYILEGLPLNDIGYYAGYPSQWADSENLKTVSLTQGTVDLDSPTVNAGGGLIDLYLRDPPATPGGLAEFSYGSYHMTREFLRADTGNIADTGLRGFVSFSQTNADNWRGAGHDSRQHIDFKFTKDFAGGSTISIVGSYHDAILSSYPSPTLQQWKANGRSFNYDATYAPGDTNYWKLYQQPWRDVQLSVPAHIVLNDTLTFDTAPYFEHGFGNTPYGTILPTTGLFQGTQPITQPIAIPNAQNGQALVQADYIGNQYRAGVNSKLTETFGANRLVFGWWYDYADDYDPEPFTPVSLSGEPASVWGFPDVIRLANGQELSAQEAHTREQVNALFIGDTLTLGKLQIEAGLKYAMVNRDGTNSLPGPQYRVGLNSSQPLPRASARYQVTPTQTLFTSVSTNFRSPVEYVLYNTYDPYSGSILTQGRDQKDEYSISEEIGWRYQGVLGNASVDVFNYNFTNRQVATVVGANQIGSNINAGGQTSRGVDVEAGLKPWHHLRPYISAAYLHATIDNNFLVGTDYLPTSGKIAVRSPRVQAALGLDFDNGPFFANFDAKYVGSQYATFMDDERIPSHAQADATLGYRLPDIGFAKKPEARLNLINIADAKFLSGAAAVEPNAQTQIGVHGTVIPGTAPTYYIGPGFAAVLTVVSGF
jgi:outer membrane receptor protein involved in Fe transport